VPSHHSLAIRVERYRKIGAYIGAMGDVVIFVRGRREERREGARD
jgi:hypothetical protein